MKLRPSTSGRGDARESASSQRLAIREKILVRLPQIENQLTSVIHHLEAVKKEPGVKFRFHPKKAVRTPLRKAKMVRDRLERLQMDIETLSLDPNKPAPSTSDASRRAVGAEIISHAAEIIAFAPIAKIAGATLVLGAVANIIAKHSEDLFSLPIFTDKILMSTVLLVFSAKLAFSKRWPFIK